MNPTPKEDFVLTHPVDDKGQDIKFRFMLTLSKPLQHRFSGHTKDAVDTVETRLMRSLATLDGIDGIGAGMGRYTLEMTIARTFDPDEVIAELKHRLKEEVLTEIVRPKLLIPGC